MTMNIESKDTNSNNYTNMQASPNSNEMLEKKRKLTLPLDTGSNHSSNTSISSNESSQNLLTGFLNSNQNGSTNGNTNLNKKFKSIYQDGGYTSLNADTPLNKDILNNIELPTPQIDRLLAEFGNGNFKTPVLLTPSMSISILNQPVSSNTSNQVTSTQSTTLITPLDPSTTYQYMNNPAFTSNDSYYEKSGLTPLLPSLPPSVIFGTSQVDQNNNEDPKYTTLAPTTNSSLNLNQNTGNNNFYVLQTINNTSLEQTNSSNQNTVSVTNSSQISTGNMPLKKDEPQTVPVHSLNGKKRSAKIKNTLASSESSAIYPSELKQEPLPPSSISSRRDTNKSTTSSTTNGEAYSPLDMDDQETRKLEKKRERNREAARKCRTRKLEKIATLEAQVKSLTDSNEKQRSTNRALLDEINEIKKKLASHQKLHNCDLKLDNLNMF